MWLLLGWLACSTVALTQASDISVPVAEDGSYTVEVRGKVWFKSSATTIVQGGVEYSTADKSLTLSAKSQQAHGWDALWRTSTGTMLTTSVRVSKSHAVFTQRFPYAVANTSTGDRDQLVSAFPSLQPAWTEAKGVLAYKGFMTGTEASAGMWEPSAADLAAEPVIGSGIGGSGPVVVFTSDLGTSIVLSAFSNFMSHSQLFNPKTNTLAYGIMGAVTEVPQGFSISTVISVGEGISSAMDSWGDLLLGEYGARGRYDYRNDLGMKYLGYSTDNGAYYYYNTVPGVDYQQTMAEIAKQGKLDGVPYRYLLLDSWWYLQGYDGGVKTWEPRADVFPGGLEAVLEITGHWPQQLHNRMWATDNTYAKQNGGKYNFIIDGSNVSVPDDQNFWNDLLMNKTKSGMFMYEQDWLNIEFDKSHSLGENATLGRSWLLQLNEGARYANVTVQLCMAYVREVLQSVEMSQVTNTRASNDYQPGNSQWNIGTTSILAHALGLAPSKDNYWSNSTVTLERYHKKPELYPELQAAVSTFSAGPVAPADMLGSANVSLILRSCDRSGRLLSPDRPAAELDRVIAMMARGQWTASDGHMWVTSVSLGSHQFKFVMTIFLKGGQNITMDDLGLGGTAMRYAALEDGSLQVHTILNGKPLAVDACSGGSGLRVYSFSPVSVGGYALLGERAKWVAISRQRFADLVFSSQGATVSVTGSTNEVVDVLWKTPAGMTVSHCAFSAAQKQGELSVMVASVQGSVASCKAADAVEPDMELMLV